MENGKKVALITGATGELGKVLVEEFLANDYDVVGTSRPGKSEPVESNNPRMLEVNLLSETDCEELAKSLGSAPLHAVVMSAGGFAMGNLETTDESALDKLIALNFKTAYNVVRQVFPLLGKNGRIIFISGRPSMEPAAGQHMISYAISKSMLHQLATLLNEKGKSKGIVSSVVVPGVMNTHANRMAMPDEDHLQWVDLKKVAETIAFLCSESGSELRDPIVKLYGNS